MRYCKPSFLILLGAMALDGCSEGVLDPKGPIASAELKILVELARNHAGDRDPDDPRHSRRRLLVPCFQQARGLLDRTSPTPADSSCSSGRFPR